MTRLIGNMFVAYSHFIRRDIWNRINRRLYDRSGYYLIVLNNQTTDQLRIVRDIFRDWWADHMANVDVLVPDIINGGSILYTYFPYTATHCDRAVPVILDRFSGHFSIHDSDFYPNKFKNMYKCKMYWSMAHYQPYAIYKNDIISGFENDLMMGLADYLNFTLVNYPSLQKFNIKVGFDIANEMVK